ncbi:MAG: Ig-like domain-containing protein [Luteolibacter sp.]
MNRLLQALCLLPIAGYGIAVSYAQVRTLTVNSTQFTNQPVTVSPVDNASQGNGTSPFTRTYNNGTNVTLAAPYTSFVKWQKDGVQVSTDPTTTVAMDANHTMTAVYLSNPPLGPFTNGSFENEFTGWYWYGSAQTVKVKTGLPSTNGSTVIEFNSSNSPNDGGLVQSFTTTPGKSYTVTFDQGVLSYTNAPQVMRVHVAGTSNLLTQDFSLNGIGGGNVNYASRSVSFTADSATTTLSFFDKSSTTNSIDLLLDNVAVNETGAPVLGTNALSNGSFEQDYNGWSPAGATRIEAPGPPYTTDGLKMLSFNVGEAPTDGAVSQSFATTPGASYSVQFDFGTLGYKDSQQTIRTLVTGSGTLLNQTASVTCRPDYVIVWAAVSYTFIANSQVTTLTLSDASATGNALDGFLDNVRVIGTTGGGNTAPVAVADSYSTGTNTPLAISAAGVLANDTDAQANLLTAAINAGPGHGTVTLNPNGSFTYTPTAGYTGADSFTYHANDGSMDSNIATVSISIGTVTGANVLLNGSFESNFSNWTTTGNQVIQSSAPYTATNGTKLVGFNGANLTPNGVLSQSFTTIAGQSYTLAFDAGVLSYNTNSQMLQVTVNGSATLLTRVITINGPGGGNTLWQPQSFNFVADSTVSTLTFRDQSSSTNGLDLVLDNVRVTGQAGTIDTAPVAFADSYPTPLNTVLVVAASGVLSNDTDGEGDSLSAALHAVPTHGSLTLNPNGGFTYTPNNGYSGPDSFTYHASDGVLDSNVATVSLTVGSPGSQLLVNGSFESGFSGWTATGNQFVESSSPYAATDGSQLAAFNGGNLTANAVLSQTFTTVAGQTYTLAFDAGVLAYNTNSQQLQATVDGSANLLTLVINPIGAGNGTNVWSPKTYTFVADSTVTTLTFRDQSVATNGIDLTLDNVRINGSPAVSNTAPVAVADSYTAVQNTTLSISGSGVLANDTDAESNSLTAAQVSNVAHGTLALNANGGFTYTPFSGYAGPDSFTYKANDGALDSNAATVSINVTAASPQLLVNGSFESNYTGWSTSGNQIIESASPYAATNGAKLVGFNGRNLSPNAVLSQSFATVAGQTYSLTFDAGVLSFVSAQQKLQVTVDGNVNLLNQLITINATNTGTSVWSSRSFSFTANSSSTTLTFTDKSTATTSLDLLLDNVKVASNAAPAALPSSLLVDSPVSRIPEADPLPVPDTSSLSGPSVVKGTIPKPSVGLEVIGGKKYLVLTLAKPAVPDGVKRVVEVSPDLQNWFSGTKHTTIITDNEKVLKVRDNTPIRPGTKRYIRLK